MAYGAIIPGQTNENGNMWFMCKTVGINDSTSIGITGSSPMGERKVEALGNNIYKLYRKGGKNDASELTLWWPLYGGTESSEFGVRYLMRALP